MAEDEESFAALLAESEAQGKSQGKLRPGDQVRGRIVEIGASTAFVNVGGHAEATIDVAELKDAETGELQFQVGDEIEGHVTDDGRRSGTIVIRRMMGRGANIEEIEQAYAHGIAIEGLVAAQNKGGYDVQIAGLRAFCPASQMDLRRGEPESYVGQRFRFRITKLENNGRNIVVSRRDVLEEEARAQALATWERLKVGAVVQGTVVSLRDFGAFVDIGGIEGLIHLSELGYARSGHPSEVLEVGQRVEAQILKIEPGSEGKRARVSLSLRALAADPWAEVPKLFPVGSIVQGTVRRVEQFGAFVELAPGIEGLVHVSQMALDRRVAHARQAATVGQPVEVTVVSIDPEKRRIALSMSAQARQQRDAEQAAEVQETAAIVAQSNRQGRSLGTFADLLGSSQRKKR